MKAGFYRFLSIFALYKFVYSAANHFQMWFREFFNYSAIAVSLANSFFFHHLFEHTYMCLYIYIYIFQRANMVFFSLLLCKCSHVWVLYICAHKMFIYFWFGEEWKKRAVLWVSLCRMRKGKIGAECQRRECVCLCICVFELWTLVCMVLFAANMFVYCYCCWALAHCYNSDTDAVACVVSEWMNEWMSWERIQSVSIVRD